MPEKRYLEPKEEEQIIISKEQYDEYNRILSELQNRNKEKATLEEKISKQAKINEDLKKKLEESNRNTEIEEKYNKLLGEAQLIYSENQKLEKGIVNLIKSLA